MYYPLLSELSSRNPYNLLFKQQILVLLVLYKLVVGIKILTLLSLY